MADDAPAYTEADRRMHRLFSFRGLRWSNRAIPVVLLGLTPLAGVLALGWNAGELLLAYGAENLLVGALMVPALVLCRRHGPPDTDQPPIRNVHIAGVTGLFFFMTGGHLLFLTFLAMVIARDEFSFANVASAAVPGFLEIGYGFAAFAWGKAYLRTSPAEASMLPFRRLLILHFVILVAAFAVFISGAGVAGVVVLVLIKVPLDVILYLREHPALNAQTQTGTKPVPVAKQAD